MYNRTSGKGDTLRVRLRLIDGRNLTLYHSTGIRAKIEDLKKFTLDGNLKPKVTVYNKQLKADLNAHFTAMSKAYARMKARGMDMTSAVLEEEIEKVMNPIAEVRKASSETLCERYVRFAEEQRRDGIIGIDRFKMIVGQADKLKRFLIIKGLSKIAPAEFDTNLLLEYRQFVFDEYQYVAKYPKLYPAKRERVGRRPPERRVSVNTVVNTMKNLQALFNELEKTDEIIKSPFRRLTTEKKRAVMHTMYDSPYSCDRMSSGKSLTPKSPRNSKGPRTHLSSTAASAAASAISAACPWKKCPSALKESRTSIISPPRPAAHRRPIRKSSLPSSGSVSTSSSAQALTSG